MARPTAEERERRREREETEAWREYVRELSKLDNALDAQRLANRGPANGEPGGRVYHNLGCFLRGYEPDTPTAGEKEEFRKYLERAKAAGKPGMGNHDW
jgi:hypothetical protein